MNLKEKMIKATEAFAKENGYTEERKVGYTEQQQEIIKAFAGFTEICSKGRCQLSKLVSAMTGIPATALMDEYNKRGGVTVKFIPFAVVVVLGNDNNHNYPLETPLMLVEEDGVRAIMSSGTLGNHLTKTKDLIRPATLEEIERFYKEFIGD